MNDQLLGTAISLLPDVIDLLKDAFKKDHPELPQPTSDEVVAAYTLAIMSSLAKDERWLAAHPA